MAVMLKRWNDDKMDALDAKVDRLEIEMRDLRTEMKSGFDRLHRLMIQFGGGMIVALFVALAAGV